MAVVFLALPATVPTRLWLWIELLSESVTCVMEVKQEVDSDFVDRTIQKRTSVGVGQRIVAMAKDREEEFARSNRFF